MQASTELANGSTNIYSQQLKYYNPTKGSLKDLQITYNLLNLPGVVSQAGNEKATYSWFADGSKYRVLDESNNGGTP